MLRLENAPLPFYSLLFEEEFEARLRILGAHWVFDVSKKVVNHLRIGLKLLSASRPGQFLVSETLIVEVVVQLEIL